MTDSVTSESANRSVPYAVIFDVDGVLVDSYDAHLRSWQQLAARYGRTCTEAEFAAGFGRTTREVLQTQWQDAALNDDQIAELDDEKEAIFRDLIASDFPAMPGARQLIDALVADGWKIALGSSGPKANVDLAIACLDLAGIIGAAISGNDVTRGKPDPEVFLTAAARLNVPPDRCIVVEDAVHGVEAAHAAGMKCIGFVSRGRTAEELAISDVVVHSLADITPPGKLRALLGGPHIQNSGEPSA